VTRGPISIAHACEKYLSYIYHIYLYRLIEIDGTFAPRTVRRGRTKRIKRNSSNSNSFIIRVRNGTVPKTANTLF